MTLSGDYETKFMYLEKRVINMYVKEVLVQNKAGLHARPATFFIQKANSLGIIGGTTIKIIADGSDETDAVEGLAALVESGFAE